MNTTVTRYRDRNAGFVRGIAALDPDTITAHADDLRFLARLNWGEHPTSPTAAALLRGTEQLLRRLHEDIGIPVPDDIPTIAPELMKS